MDNVARQSITRLREAAKRMGGNSRQAFLRFKLTKELTCGAHDDVP